MSFSLLSSMRSHRYCCPRGCDASSHRFLFHSRHIITIEYSIYYSLSAFLSFWYANNSLINNIFYVLCICIRLCMWEMCDLLHLLKSACIDVKKTDAHWISSIKIIYNSYDQNKCGYIWWSRKNNIFCDKNTIWFVTDLSDKAKCSPMSIFDD